MDSPPAPPSAPAALAHLLERGEISAVALPGLPVVSLYDHDEYENYDLDMIGPLRRLAVAKRLRECGFRHRSGRVLEAPEEDLRAVFPRPGSLWSDPRRAVREELGQPGTVVLVTPTQALLLLLGEMVEAGPGSDGPLGVALGDLVHEQPANLDKAAQWTRGEREGRLLARLRPELERRQAAGIEERRRRGRSRRSR